MNTPPRKNSSTLVHSLAKVFDSNAIQSQGPPPITGSSRKSSESSRCSSMDSFNVMDIKLESLSQTVDKILCVQENVVQKLDGITQDVVRIGKDIEMLKVGKEKMKQGIICHGGEHKYTNISGEISDLLSTLKQSSKEQTKKIDGIENVLLGVQQVINYLGETFKNSRIAEFILKGQVSPKPQSALCNEGQKISKKRIISGKVVLRRKKVKVKDHRANEVKGKQTVIVKEIKSPQKKKSPESTGQIQKSLQTLADTKVQNLSQVNGNCSSDFEAQHEVEDLPEQNNVTKFKANISEEDVRVQFCGVAKATASAIASEFSDTTLDTYAIGEKKGEDTVAEEQCKIKFEEGSHSVMNHSCANQENGERIERKSVMQEKMQNITTQGKMQAEKNSNKYIIKELIAELVPMGRKDDLQVKENEATGKEHLQVEEQIDAVMDTRFESKDLTITKESKGKVTEEESSKIQQSVLLHSCGEREREDDALSAAVVPEERTFQHTEQKETEDLSTSSKMETEGDVTKDDSRKSKVEEKGWSQEQSLECGSSQNAALFTDREQENNQMVQETEEQREHIVIDDGPAPPAPFEHRIVSTNVAQISNYYTIQKSEVLGGIEGGELFDRIIDENYNLTEMDTILFVRQICEGLQYMHQMYILHLDLKPENILCVNREANQVKIIDFGLARRYKPREKLKINFGTPEFLAPEVVNYDFVSFPTDMWSLGVIAYMLLSGLSPFLGEDDNETLNNILACKWDLDDAEFENVSEDAKEFISKLLIKEKSGRISATQCLKQPWLNNIAEKAKQCKVRLKSQILLQKYMVRRLWKKNYYAVTAANRLKKLSDSGALGPVEV
ncbi:myosin light chain kinase 3 isoform X4 [Narcine bancroftii]|uniref:myosin light chain kinase 3 isoform X4 n=1 Tax=Narcine bancroftii TaxID=1343680 RepID=UPI003831D958